MKTEASKSEEVGKLVVCAFSAWPTHEAVSREEESEGAARLSPLMGTSAKGGGNPVLSTGEGEECIDGVGSQATVNASSVVSIAAMARAVVGKTEGKQSTSVVDGCTASIACSKDEVGSSVTKVPAC